MTNEAIVPSWEDVANRWERAYNETCQEVDRLKAELRQERMRFADLWRIDMIHLGLPPEWPKGYEDVTEGLTP